MKHRLMIALALMIVMLGVGSVAAIARAENAGAPAEIPMQSHDFTDVPVAGKEFMEPFINDFYHQGITGGCNPSPLQFCPEAYVTRAEMAVFMGRALGYRQAVIDGYPAEAYFKDTVEGYGVVGRSTEGGYGVYGTSNYGTGVLGDSTGGFGVVANSTNTYGLVAQSTNANALYVGTGANQFFDGIYDIVLNGYGEIFAQDNIDLVTNETVYIHLDYDNNGIDFFRVVNGSQALIFNLDEAGNWSVTGSKSATVETESFGDRLMYSVEATEVLFEDVGSAQLVDGEAIIEFDPIFAETVNLSEEYQVFLTPVGGWAELYIAEQTTTHFVVRSADSTSDLRFHYRIVAKRLGYEDVRTEPMQVPERQDPHP